MQGIVSYNPMVIQNPMEKSMEHEAEMGITRLLR